VWLHDPVPALRGKDYGKTKMRYPDYVQTDSGLQYKDLRPGAGPAPKIGSTVVVRLTCWALVQSNLSRRAKRISDILEEPGWF
jgi:hypothetical protein